MDDLVQWLRAQFDEDERWANEEDPGGMCDGGRRRLFRDDVASAGALLQMVAVVKLLAERVPYELTWALFGIEVGAVVYWWLS